MLIDEIEFDVAYDNRIVFLYSHLAQFGYNSLLAEYFLEIRHGIGVVERNVTAKHIHKRTDYHISVAVHINFETEVPALRIRKILDRKSVV